jgi:predicted metal-dependent HD superfamily phosphohydrolase
MKERWKQIWQKLDAPVTPVEILEELLGAYSSGDRYYHNLVHIQDCLAIFDETRFLANSPEAVELAIWFHDAVYDPKRSDNEERSAAWAKSAIAQSGLSSDFSEYVSRLILATCHNAIAQDRDTQLLMDIDLSILGREPEIFWRYENNIRKEYAWVPEDIFKQKRIEVLHSFLERSHIYYLDIYRNRFEVQARQNLEQAIARLV